MKFSALVQIIITLIGLVHCALSSASSPASQKTEKPSRMEQIQNDMFTLQVKIQQIKASLRESYGDHWNHIAARIEEAESLFGAIKSKHDAKPENQGIVKDEFEALGRAVGKIKTMYQHYHEKTKLVVQGSDQTGGQKLVLLRDLSKLQQEGFTLQQESTLTNLTYDQLDSSIGEAISNALKIRTHGISVDTVLAAKMDHLYKALVFIQGLWKEFSVSKLIEEKEILESHAQDLNTKDANAYTGIKEKRKMLLETNTKIYEAYEKLGTTYKFVNSQPIVPAIWRIAAIHGMIKGDNASKIKTPWEAFKSSAEQFLTVPFAKPPTVLVKTEDKVGVERELSNLLGTRDGLMLGLAELTNTRRLIALVQNKRDPDMEAASAFEQVAKDLKTALDKNVSGMTALPGRKPNFEGMGKELVNLDEKIKQVVIDEKAAEGNVYASKDLIEHQTAQLAEHESLQEELDNLIHLMGGNVEAVRLKSAIEYIEKAHSKLSGMIKSNGDATAMHKLQDRHTVLQQALQLLREQLDRKPPQAIKGTADQDGRRIALEQRLVQSNAAHHQALLRKIKQDLVPIEKAPTDSEAAVKTVHGLCLYFGNLASVTIDEPQRANLEEILGYLREASAKLYKCKIMTAFEKRQVQIEELRREIAGLKFLAISKHTTNAARYQAEANLVEKTAKVIKDLEDVISQKQQSQTVVDEQITKAMNEILAALKIYNEIVVPAKEYSGLGAFSDDKLEGEIQTRRQKLVNLMKDNYPNLDAATHLKSSLDAIHSAMQDIEGAKKADVNLTTKGELLEAIRLVAEVNQGMRNTTDEQAMVKVQSAESSQQHLVKPAGPSKGDPSTETETSSSQKLGQGEHSLPPKPKDVVLDAQAQPPSQGSSLTDLRTEPHESSTFLASKKEYEHLKALLEAKRLECCKIEGNNLAECHPVTLRVVDSTRELIRKLGSDHSQHTQQLQSAINELTKSSGSQQEAISTCNKTFEQLKQEVASKKEALDELVIKLQAPSLESFLGTLKATLAELGKNAQGNVKMVEAIHKVERQIAGLPNRAHEERK